MTWFAVRGKQPETVRAELGVHNTGQSVAFPAPHIAGATLPGGWYLVQRNRYECQDDSILGRLSIGCEVISLFVEEHVMFSRLSGWKDGRRLWSVVHDSEEDDQHLETDGDLPSDFASIRDEVRTKSDEMLVRHGGRGYLDDDLPLQGNAVFAEPELSTLAGPQRAAVNELSMQASAQIEYIDEVFRLAGQPVPICMHCLNSVSRTSSNSPPTSAKCSN